jgi:hypothetical protein
MRFLAYAWSLVMLAIAACTPPSNPPAATRPHSQCPVDGHGQGDRPVASCSSPSERQRPFAQATDTVTVHYRGCPDGREFDSSYKRGQRSFSR